MKRPEEKIREISDARLGSSEKHCVEARVQIMPKYVLGYSQIRLSNPCWRKNKDYNFRNQSGEQLVWHFKYRKKCSSISIQVSCLIQIWTSINISELRKIVLVELWFFNALTASIRMKCLTRWVVVKFIKPLYISNLISYTHFGINNDINNNIKQ